MKTITASSISLIGLHLWESQSQPSSICTRRVVCFRNLFLFLYCFASSGGSPLYPEFLQYYTMILQRPRIIVGDARFEPGTSAPEVWRAPLIILIEYLVYTVSCCTGGGESLLSKTYTTVLRINSVLGGLPVFI